MEQQLKERLVGASVLVTIGMLVIPALLDGTDPSQRGRAGLELAGKTTEPARTEIKLDIPGRDREGPSAGRISKPPPDPAIAQARAQSAPRQIESAVVEPDPGEPEAAPSAKAPAAAVTPPPDRRPVASATTRWAVQVGSFSRADNAERLAQDLRRRGFDVSVTRIDGSGGPMHRVRVGPVDARKDAEALALRLQAAGQQGRVVRSEG